MLPDVSHFRLTNALVPACLLHIDEAQISASRFHGQSPFAGDDLCKVDIEVQDGLVVAIAPAGQMPPAMLPCLAVDLRNKQVWPCFVDMHTHLDKGHTWERTPNPGRTFEDAIKANQKDSSAYWTEEDVYRRMEFGLKCSYAHGTSVIRTHIDSAGEQAQISLDVFQQLQREWSDRLTLQAVCLVTLDYYLTPAGEALADLMATVPGGVLGGVAFPSDSLDRQLDRVFELARERNLPLDFHSDESGNPADKSLRMIAQAAFRHQFDHRIICGHCCSLAVQPPDEVHQTLALVREANIGIVSLPLCNLYLQDRYQDASQHFLQTAADSSLPMHTGHSPRWRGMTLLHELEDSDVPTAIASDNCRDVFFGFGDHDAFEVFNQSVRIAHLDAPYGNWPGAIARVPADLLELPNHGRIGVGLPADLVIFKARTFSELLSRPQSDRIVLRQGRSIDTTLPEYEELDDLVMIEY